MSSNLSDLKNKTNALISSLIDEARSDSGTWSLATYNNLTETFPKCSLTEARLITSKLVQEFLNNETTPRTRYKLAQLFSLFKNQKIKVFHDSLLTFGTEINQFIDENLRHGDQLSNAAANLMKSTLSASSQKVQATTPPPMYQIGRRRGNDFVSKTDDC